MISVMVIISRCSTLALECFRILKQLCAILNNGNNNKKALSSNLIDKIEGRSSGVINVVKFVRGT